VGEPVAARESGATTTTAGGAGLSHRQILVVYSGLMAGMLLAALDQTIVATALPTIVGDLHGLNHLSWVVTAYLLTSTISVPLYGKISDLYGRKNVFQFAIGVFLIGSILAGLSQNMPQLIVFRGLQGIGGGGLMVMAMAIVGDIVSPRERGRYQGYLGAVFAFSSVVGPLLGGFIVDHSSWRWIFYINVPIGAAALVITSMVLDLPYQRLHHVIDFLGAALVMGSATCLLLVAVWGGTSYPWTSRTIIGLSAAGVVLLILFLLQERRASEPLIPPKLWRNRVFSVSNGLVFVTGFAMFGSIVFLPLYLQTVGGASAENSGLLILPLMAGIVVMSITSGRLITRTGKYKAWPVCGTAIVAFGLYLFSTMGVGTSRATSSLYMVVVGAGMGMLMQVMVLAVQNSVEYRDLGTATAAVNFFRSMGGAFGVSISGAILTNRLAYYLPRFVPGGASGGVNAGALTSGPAAIKRLPPPILEGVLQAIAHSIQDVFLASVPLAVLAFIGAFLLPEIPLRQTSHMTMEAAAGEPLVPEVEQAALETEDESERALEPAPDLEPR